MKKIAIIPPGTLPLPPVQGGAVENLIDLFRKKNEGSAKINLTLFSINTPAARKQAYNTVNTNYYFIKIPFLVCWLDLINFWFVQHVFHKQNSRSYRYIFQRLYFILKTALQLKHGEYDRVILENHTSLLLALKLFKNDRKYRGRYYYHIHNRINSFYGCETIFSHCAGIIGVSSYILSTLPAIASQTPKYILKNRVDEKIFHQNYSFATLNRARNNLNLQNQKIVLFTGRLSKEKGIDALLSAWKQLNLSNATLLIVGNSFFKSGVHTDFEKKLMSLASGSKNIRFTGFLNYQQMPLIYQLADLVVLPSIWDDPAPLTVIETLTMGKKLITTNAGGIPEYVDKNTVILNRDRDLVKNLARAIEQKLNNNHQIKPVNWKFKDYYQQLLKILKG